jgi:hypothetical protein
VAEASFEGCLQIRFFQVEGWMVLAEVFEKGQIILAAPEKRRLEEPFEFPEFSGIKSF